MIAAITASLARGHAPALDEIRDTLANLLDVLLHQAGARRGGSRQPLTDAIGLAIAEGLPPAYRGAPRILRYTGNFDAPSAEGATDCAA